VKRGKQRGGKKVRGEREERVKSEGEEERE
jgi:hypothetical protein